jgi:hypothetical protein
MQTFTRANVGTYLEKTPDKVDLRFAPLRSVEKGDIVHQRAAEHLSLHRSMFSDEPLELQQCLDMQYVDILFTFFYLYGRDGEKAGA